jgi:hypothetical protein
MDTYQFYWMTGLPLVTLLGWVAHLSGRTRVVFRVRICSRIGPVTALLTACVAAAALLGADIGQNLVSFTTRSAPGYASLEKPLKTADQLVDGYLAGHANSLGGRGVLLLDLDPQGKDATVVTELMRNLYQNGWHPILPPQQAAHDELPNPPDPVRCTIVIADRRTEVPAGYTVLGTLGPGPNAPVAAVRL